MNLGKRYKKGEVSVEFTGLKGCDLDLLFEISFMTREKQNCSEKIGQGGDLFIQSRGEEESLACEESFIALHKVIGRLML